MGWYPVISFRFSMVNPESPISLTNSHETAKHMGVSENSVPLNPMVNDHYPVFKWL